MSHRIQLYLIICSIIYRKSGHETIDLLVNCQAAYLSWGAPTCNYSKGNIPIWRKSSHWNMGKNLLGHIDKIR